MKKSLMQKLLLNCDEATFLSTKAQYTNLTLKEKILFYLHRKWCPPCEDYHISNNNISKIVKDQFQESDRALEELRAKSRNGRKS